jgi:ketopantoate reductase
VQSVNIIGAGGIGVVLGGALARAGWNVTMVDIHEAKLEAGRRDGIEVNGVKEKKLLFASFAEWRPTDGAILLLCTKTYDNATVLARIPLRHLLVPIQNGFDPMLNESSHPFEGIASFVSQCESNRPSTKITRKGGLYLGGRRPLTVEERAVLKELAGGFRQGGVDQVSIVPLIGGYKSAKLMYNAAISPLAAAAGIDNEELLGDPVAQRLFLLCSGKTIQFYIVVARNWPDRPIPSRGGGSHSPGARFSPNPSAFISPRPARHLLLDGPGYGYGTNRDRRLQWLSETSGSGHCLSDQYRGSRFD